MFLFLSRLTAILSIVIHLFATTSAYFPSNCGRLLSDIKISHGNKTELFEFPWMAFIQSRATNDSELYAQCGGTIISERYILTAAHCFEGYQPISIRIGEHDLLTDPDCEEYDNERICAPKVQVITDIEAVISHPDRDRKMRTHDIALLKVKPMKFSDSVQPICLPIKSQYKNHNLAGGVHLTVAGWGYNSTEYKLGRIESTPSSVLLKAHLIFVSKEECAVEYEDQSFEFMLSDQLCARNKRDRADACGGDSGGPLMVPIFDRTINDFVYVQFGIVSFGQRLCNRGSSGVYTNIASHLEWIFKNVN